MDHNDHLSEKLRLKEVADEDCYFGERDRKLLASLKERRADEEEHLLRERSRGRCLHCGEHLQQRCGHSTTILECQPCQGIWLHKDQLPILTHSSGTEWLDQKENKTFILRGEKTFAGQLAVAKEIGPGRAVGEF